MQIAFNFNTAKPGRSRKRDPSTAKDAALRTDATRLENIVYQFLMLMYPRDFNTKELSQELRIDRLSVSPRMVCLERQGKAQRFGRRDGCETWRAVK